VAFAKERWSRCLACRGWGFVKVAGASHGEADCPECRTLDIVPPLEARDPLAA